MQIPDWFARQLAAEHNNRLRIRWSDQQQQFLIEQKNSPGRMPQRPLDSLDDRAIQIRDGYIFVLGVTPGDRTRCSSCQRGTHVPVMEMRFARCEHCGKEFRACYWPLGDGLLQWLRWSDPYRDGLQRQMSELERSESARERGLRRKTANDIEDISKDEFTKLFQIQSVGYTGRENAWIR